MISHFLGHNKIQVKQSFELFEVFNFETRNKYRISDEHGQPLAFAAEQNKGFWGFIGRQFLGHWRSFDILFYDNNRQLVVQGHHPFRWFFQRLEVRAPDGRPLGAVQLRWSIFTKSFDVYDSQDRLLFEVRSPLWKLWTFPFVRGGREHARILKKWSGIGYEMFTDRDNFLVEFPEQELTGDERALVVAAAVYVDIMYFENKQGGGLWHLFD